MNPKRTECERQVKREKAAGEKSHGMNMIQIEREGKKLCKPKVKESERINAATYTQSYLTH